MNDDNWPACCHTGKDRRCDGVAHPVEVTRGDDGCITADCPCGWGRMAMVGAEEWLQECVERHSLPTGCPCHPEVADGECDGDGDDAQVLRVGDRVQMRSPGGGIVTGVVLRSNSDHVSVHHLWNGQEVEGVFRLAQYVRHLRPLEGSDD